MKIGFYLAHPAHFYLFKNVIISLKKSNDVFIVYNKKDILDQLITKSGLIDSAYEIKVNTKINNNILLLVQFILKIWGAFRLFRKLKLDLVIGTPILISLVGHFLPYKSIIVNEDDFDIIKKTTNLGYPYADTIICPDVCKTGKFSYKSYQYKGYHELAYLHPKYFKPNKNIIEKYFPTRKPYFVLRFAQLSAHHDKGITGITYDIANKLIFLLKPHGNIYISAERKLESDFEQYRLNIDPLDIHHVMAYAKMYIGDSQTMAAEAAVLGTPSIRYNDFVGKLGYLEELEHKYYLTYGFKTSEPDKLFQKIEELLTIYKLKEQWQRRQKKMFEDKIDVTAFIVWFIENYPNSTKIMKINPDYQYNFK